MMASPYPYVYALTIFVVLTMAFLNYNLHEGGLLTYVYVYCMSLPNLHR